MPKLLAVLGGVVISLLLIADDARAEEVWASCYGSESGSWTASGDPFDPSAFAAAHPTLPFGTLLRVGYGSGWIVVVVNDRGPFIGGRSLDLTCGAMGALGLPPGVYLVDMMIL